jgi:transcriptional regulator with XRE-family HTH domain
MAGKEEASGKMIGLLLGKNLKQLRTNAELSQLALAEKANLTLSCISDIENGKKWPSCKTLTRLCLVLHVEPRQFFFPLSKTEQERSEILSSYIDVFSDSILKSVKEFRTRYLNDDINGIE